MVLSDRKADDGARPDRPPSKFGEVMGNSIVHKTVS